MAISGYASINFNLVADTVNKVYATDVTAESFNWDITNLVLGSVRTVTAGVINLSDCTYDKFMDRVWFIRNDSDDILCYPRSSLYDNTAATSLIRTIELTPTVVDSEGIDGPWWNEAAQAYESIDSDEQAGRNAVFFREWTEAQLTGSDDFTLAELQELILAALNADNNSGPEGVAYDPYTGTIHVCIEGQQASTPRDYLKAARPTNRTTDYSHTDPELTVTQGWDPEVEDHMTLYGATGAAADLASVVFHAPSQSLIWLSQTGDRIIQTDLVKNILGSVDLSSIGLSQAEGLCFIGDDLVICGEPNEYVIGVYTP